MSSEDSEARHFGDAAAWSRWLHQHHKQDEGVWLRVAKKDSGEVSVSCPEALDVALCYGWIDGQRKGLDSRFFLQKYTPRRARSPWSKVNRLKVQALIASGAMQPAGLAEIERAKKDGRWDAAYDGSRTMQDADDLKAALKKEPVAAAFFEQLDSRNRFAINFRLQQAKKPETRASRLAGFIAMLACGETLYPMPAKAGPVRRKIIP